MIGINPRKLLQNSYVEVMIGKGYRTLPRLEVAGLLSYLAKQCTPKFSTNLIAFEYSGDPDKLLADKKLLYMNLFENMKLCLAKNSWTSFVNKILSFAGSALANDLFPSVLPLRVACYELKIEVLAKVLGKRVLRFPLVYTFVTETAVKESKAIILEDYVFLKDKGVDVEEPPLVFLLSRGEKISSRSLELTLLTIGKLLHYFPKLRKKYLAALAIKPELSDFEKTVLQIFS